MPWTYVLRINPRLKTISIATNFRDRRGALGGLAGLVCAALGCLLIGAPSAHAGTVPSGFQDQVAISGLTQPTNFSFAADGRIFVSEKSGIIKEFDSLSDSTPTQVADLTTDVYNYWDRGLLGMALDPQFTTGRPYLYVLYTRDALPGGNSPRWGTVGNPSESCPDGDGGTGDGCVVTGRLARLTISGNVATGQTNLITDWCQQYPSHSIGDLAFGADGKLYVSGGEGASFTFTDWGQAGNPANPCGDPPGGTSLSPPTAEGGSLRSQDARSTLDPTGLDGSILRIDPDTGAGLPDNPFAASSDANQKRIVAYGLRNPFRFTFRPGTNEVWAGDVGQDNWEEIDRLVTPADSTADNFGWPCYEGVGRMASFDGANLNLCESLYSSGAVVSPYLTYNHSAHVVNGESCATGSSSISGMAFSQAGTYPSSYNGALFFGDYSRKCIWVMFPGSNGLPDLANVQVFDAGAAGPVKLAVGPQGELYYADLDGGAIRRITSNGSQPPPSNDLALNRPSSSSSVEGAGLEPSKANDGNSSTRFSSDWADNQWWQVDLGSAQQIDTVKLNWEDAYASHYQIQTSTDGTNFTQAADVTNSAPGLKTTTFTARSARYVRVLGLTRATPYGFSFWDAEVYGPGTAPPPPPSDLALNKPATSLSVEEAGLEANKANDGNSGTRWSSAFADNQWWQVDLGSAQSVDTVKLNWEDAYATHYQILTSTDGTNFTQAADVTNAAPGLKSTTFTARSARYVRVLGITRATPYGFSFWDAQVFGPSGPPPPPPNQPPNAVATATPSNGAAPLNVQLSATGSTDPDDAAGTLAYAWDADGDGQFDDGNQATVNFTYPAGNYTATVRVTDPHGASDTDSVAIQAGNSAPIATITAPASTLTWKVGDPIVFAATATDAQEILPPSAYHWQEIINHCPSNCHQHFLQDFIGPGGTLIAPDHEYPSNLELRLTVTDSGGLTDVESVIVNPKTVDLTLASAPAGLQLGVNSKTAIAPWVCTVIQGSQNTLIAPTPQTLGGLNYTFASWSDAGAASHNIIADASKTLTATYSGPPPPPADKALNQPATASSIEGAGLEANKANDGNPNTRWSSNFTNNQWWQVDLGRTRKVNKVTLNWETAYAKRYRIQTSTNGTTFTQVADVSITSPGVKTTTFTAVDARYVRVLGVTRATQWGISLWDASVFGPAD